MVMNAVLTNVSAVGLLA